MNEVDGNRTLPLTMGTSPAAARVGTYMLTLASLTWSVHEPTVYTVLEPSDAADSSARSLSPEVSDAWRAVTATIRATAFENGVDHPAELPLERFVERFGEEPLVHLTREWQQDEAAPFASLLRLVGRMPAIKPMTRRALVTRGLSSPDCDVRDAAMQCVESAQASELVPELIAHDEPDAFLDAYRLGVIEDLTG